MALIAAAVAVAAGSLVRLASLPDESEVFQSRTLTTPADESFVLPEARYTVYEETRTDLGDGTYGDPRPQSVQPHEIDVTAPDGERVAVVGPRHHDLVGGYEPVADLELPEEGTYRVRITSTDGTSGARLFLATGGGGEAFEVFLTLVAATVGALVLGAVGLVVLAAGYTARAPVRPVRAVPGWYPDPADPTRWRYWNGLAWTAQQPDGGPPSAREPGGTGGG